jgi:beta-lactam-binding protein with PASTA domain
MLELLKKFLWTLPFICFIIGYLSLTKLYPVKEIETPLVIGKTLQEACMILSSHRLNARLVNITQDALLPEGTIISQTPQSGQKIKPNQAVFIVASTQPQKNVAPHYVQKKLNEIEQEIVAQNIRAKSYPMPSIAIRDTCIAQWPEAGLPLENNKMILYVAQPTNKPILVPYLKNKPVLEVVNFLKTNNVQIELIHNAELNEEQHTCAHCVVIDQRPLAGSIISHDAQKPLRMQLYVAAS